MFDADPLNPTFGNLIQTFPNPAPEENDSFGAAIAAFGDSILIGAPGDSEEADAAGAVYLFDVATGSLLQTFLNPFPNDRDLFESSITIVGGNILIGAHNDDAGGNNVGAAYLYDGLTFELLRIFQAFQTSYVTINDTCDIGGGANNIKTVISSYDGTADKIVVEIDLCTHADSNNKTKYQVYFDHKDMTNLDGDAIDDGPDTLDSNPRCVRIFDDRMIYTHRNSRGPGTIDASGSTLIFRVGVNEFNPGLGFGDTVLIWADTQQNNVIDKVPNTESGDGCPRPEVPSEVMSLVLG